MKQKLTHLPTQDSLHLPTSALYHEFLVMRDPWRQWFMDYMAGKKTLPFTYDPFFKFIFHPDVHPQRLSRFLSALLDTDVSVQNVLPNEGSMIVDDGSLMILDVIVQLGDGSLANIEIQKIPYLFPAERMSCYSSDLVMRQYSRVRGQSGQKNSYQNMHRVYTIVLFERSTDAFHALPQSFIHRGKTTFDTGLKLNILQEYCLVALDIFQNYHYDKDINELSGWLSFLTTTDVTEAEHLMQVYPWLEELYHDAASLGTRPEEVLHMFSEALQIMDRNAMQYMIDEQQAQLDRQADTIRQHASTIEAQNSTIEEQTSTIEEQITTIEEQVSTIEKQTSTIEEQISTIEKQTSTIEEQSSTIEEQSSTIERQTSTIEEQTSTIEKQTSTIMQQAAELEKLRALLEQNHINFQS